jgi:hypothetical protein
MRARRACSRLVFGRLIELGECRASCVSDPVDEGGGTIFAQRSAMSESRALVLERGGVLLMLLIRLGLSKRVVKRRRIQIAIQRCLHQSRCLSAGV